MKILIMGLPGAGKTTLAEHLIRKLQENNKTVKWFNADMIRTQYNDWDFSYAGRIRQSERMRDLANLSSDDFVICDFIAPISEMRSIFSADYTIWVNTIEYSIFSDTNNIFDSPTSYDLLVTEKNAAKWSDIILTELLSR